MPSKKSYEIKKSAGPNVTLRIPDEMLERWDQFCEHSHITRSELIKQSVEEKLSRHIELKIDELLLHYINPINQKLDHLLDEIASGKGNK